VSEVLKEHVELEVESIDRMYLNVFVPRLQIVEGALRFIRQQRHSKVLSTTAVEPMTRGFVRAIEQFAENNEIPVVHFEKGQRKDDIATERRSEFQKPEGVVFIGKAQEKCAVYRTEKRHNPKTNKSYAWIIKSTAMVNQYYFYCVDEDFGPFFIKFCSYFPYNAKLCLNGHEYAKRQLEREGIPHQALDMAFSPVQIRNDSRKSAMVCRRRRSTGSYASGFAGCLIPFLLKIAKRTTATKSPSFKLNTDSGSRPTCQWKDFLRRGHS